MAGVDIKLSADDSDLESKLAAVTRALNEMASAAAKAGNVKIDPVKNVDLGKLRQYVDRYNQFQRLNPAFGRRVGVTNQSGALPWEVDFTRMYSDQSQRNRTMFNLFRFMTEGTFGANPPPDEGGKRPGQPSPGEDANRRPSPLSPTVRPVVDAVRRATGRPGQAVSHAIGTASEFGLAAGVGGFLGSMLGFAVDKAVGAVSGAIGGAQREYIGYDNLKRQIGDLGVSFDSLKNQTRAVSNILGMTYDEGQRVVTTFADIAGTTPETAGSLMGEVAVAGGFARSYGIAPEQGAEFFGQMRHFGVTQTTDDSRRLALYIAEAIDKGGLYTRTGEVLRALTGYVQQQSRFSLEAPNADGYLESMSAFGSMKVPGLDPQAAASMLGAVNASIQHGGNLGSASQNFFYATLGRGLNPVEEKMLQEGGAFATRASIFGKDNKIYQDFARTYHFKPVSGLGDETNLQVIMKALDKRYAGMPMLEADTLKTMFGLSSENQAMAFMTMAHSTKHFPDIFKYIKPDELSKIDPTALPAMARALDAGRPELLKMAKENGIQGDVNAMTDEKLRQALIDVLKTKGQSETEGSKTRNSINRVDNAVRDFASAAIGPLNTMRDAMLVMVGKGQSSVAKAAMDLDIKDIDRKYDVSGAESVYEAAAQRLNYDDSPEAQKEATDAYNHYRSVQNARDAAVNERKAQYQREQQQATAESEAATKAAFVTNFKPTADRIAKRLGVPSDYVLSQLAIETSWGTKSRNNPLNVEDGHGHFKHYDSQQQMEDDYVAQMRRNFPKAVGAKSIADFGDGLVHGRLGNYAGDDYAYPQKLADVKKSVDAAVAKYDTAEIPPTAADVATSPSTTIPKQAQVAPVPRETAPKPADVAPTPAPTPMPLESSKSAQSAKATPTTSRVVLELNHTHTLQDIRGRQIGTATTPPTVVNVPVSGGS